MLRGRSCNLPVAVLTGLMLAYMAASLALPDDAALKGLFRSWVHGGLMLAAAVVVVRSAWKARRERAAWWSMAVAVIAFAAGEIAWRALYASDPEPPFPSLADAGWLLTYPAFYVGTMLLARARLAGISASGWLDGLIGAFVALSLGISLYFEPVLRATDGDPQAVAITMAYPLGDILLIALIIAATALAGARISLPWLLMGAGQLAIAVGDVFYALGTANGTYVEGRWPDTLWPLGVLLIAWASRLPGPARRVTNLEGRRAFALPAAFGAAAIGADLVADLVDASDVAHVAALVALGLVVLRTLLTVRENLALVEQVHLQALTDDLTGLPNRRQLLADLHAVLDEPGRPHALTLLDLDGFKAYNDAFGHGAGDELLVRLGVAMARATGGDGRAYRLGGDEFCLLTTLDSSADDGSERARAALSAAGEGFEVRASAGTVLLPLEAREVSAALALADERMYRDKAGTRVASARRSSRDALLRLLGEREPADGERIAMVASWAWAVALQLGLSEAEAEDVIRAAELHDVGRAALPDSILEKPGELDEGEWAFVRRHPLIGELMLRREPELRRAAGLVRASRERHDGSGYPDGLAGDAIPVGARIVAVSAAFCAMVSERAWRPARSPQAALSELRRCAGSQFDPVVVESFCRLAERRATALETL
jgi:diguanylate cyclase (GGDEF)-like protein